MGETMTASEGPISNAKKMHFHGEGSLSNGLVVKVLDSQSRGPGFKIAT